MERRRSVYLLDLRSFYLWLKKPLASENERRPTRSEGLTMMSSRLLRYSSAFSSPNLPFALGSSRRSSSRLPSGSRSPSSSELASSSSSPERWSLRWMRWTLGGGRNSASKPSPGQSRFMIWRVLDRSGVTGSLAMSLWMALIPSQMLLICSSCVDMLPARSGQRPNCCRCNRAAGFAGCDMVVCRCRCQVCRVVRERENPLSGGRATNCCHMQDTCPKCCHMLSFIPSPSL
jgi:hypothetical protein